MEEEILIRVQRIQRKFQEDLSVDKVCSFIYYAYFSLDGATLMTTLDFLLCHRKVG